MRPSEKITELSDSQLYQRCKYYGANARLWMRKFASLLPEVYKRRLYKRRGYASIHEFAAKIAGMNERLVDKILNLSANLEDKPALKEQFYAGSQGWSKIEKVAFIATPETDTFWANKVEHLTQQALEAYVHEIRKMENSGEPEFTGILQAIPREAMENETQSHLSFQLSPKLEIRLRLFKHELEKERRETLGWAEVIEALLDGYHYGAVKETKVNQWGILRQ